MEELDAAWSSAVLAGSGWMRRAYPHLNFTVVSNLKKTKQIPLSLLLLFHDNPIKVINIEEAFFTAFNWFQCQEACVSDLPASASEKQSAYFLK